MRVSDRAYQRLRRLQLITGVVPLGLFLVSHLAVNSRALSGPEAYQRSVEAIARVPWLSLVELVAIALPIAAHVALGAVIATTRQAAFEPAWPGERARSMQRVTGIYLSIYVIFHVWAIRLSPARLAGHKPLFDLMAAQLAHPLVWILQALAVVAASAHFSAGLLALAGPHGWPLAPGALARWRAVAIASFALLSVIGVASLAAFVWPAARLLAFVP
jgi:succinate dehydrogenase / fumarate reductase cytochrome b subunit